MMGYILVVIIFNNVDKYVFFKVVIDCLVFIEVGRLDLDIFLVDWVQSMKVFKCLVWMDEYNKVL